jgi:hypothetical protein
MRIFVAYGYNDRDRWIREMVFPIIEAFGSDIETGEITYDGAIPNSVRNKILRSDALIGFTTRRIEADNQDNYDGRTHLWVIQELAAAYTLDKRLVEVRENGVNPQGGMLQDYQRINYDETARDKCLVKITEALGAWHSTDMVRIQLLPEGIANDDLRPLLNQGGLTCQYTVRSGSYDAPAVPVNIVPITGGLFISVPQPSRDDLIQISIRYGNRVWNSDYESLNSYGIHLRQ